MDEWVTQKASLAFSDCRQRPNVKHLKIVAALHFQLPQFSSTGG